MKRKLLSFVLAMVASLSAFAQTGTSQSSAIQLADGVETTIQGVDVNGYLPYETDLSTTAIWYVYTPTANGSVTFSFAFSPGGEPDFMTLYNGSSTTREMYNGADIVQEMSAGESFYFSFTCVSNNVPLKLTATLTAAPTPAGFNPSTTQTYFVQCLKTSSSAGSAVSAVSNRYLDLVNLGTGSSDVNYQTVCATITDTPTPVLLATDGSGWSFKSVIGEEYYLNLVAGKWSTKVSDEAFYWTVDGTEDSFTLTRGDKCVCTDTQTSGSIIYTDKGQFAEWALVKACKIVYNAYDADNNLLGTEVNYVKEGDAYPAVPTFEGVNYASGAPEGTASADGTYTLVYSAGATTFAPVADKAYFVQCLKTSTSAGSAVSTVADRYLDLENLGTGSSDVNYETVVPTITTTGTAVKFATDGTGWSIQSVVDDQYFSLVDSKWSTKLSDTPKYWTVAGTDDAFTLSRGDTKWVCTDSQADGSLIYTDKPNAAVWAIVPAINVIYNCIDDKGATIQTVPAYVKNGDAYPAAPVIEGYEYVSGLPTGNVTADATVTLTYKASVVPGSSKEAAIELPEMKTTVILPVKTSQDWTADGYSNTPIWYVYNAPLDGVVTFNFHYSSTIYNPVFTIYKNNENIGYYEDYKEETLEVDITKGDKIYLVFEFAPKGDFAMGITPVASEAYKLTVTDARYATLYLDYSVDIPTGVTCYASSLNADGVTLKLDAFDDVLPANFPAIVEANAGTYNFKKTFAPASTATSILEGTLVAMTAPVGSYVLQNKVGKVGFYEVIDVQPTIPANRCYIPATVAPSNHAFLLGGDTVTSINSVENTSNATIYDLQGRRVVAPAKGSLVIKNGQKFIQK